MDRQNLDWRARLSAATAAGLLLLGAADAVRAQPSFVNFESGQVRPLALSPDGTRLFAVNTPDNRLEIFSVGAGGPDPRRVGAGRPRAGRGRGAHEHRGLGGEPPLRLDQHRRRRRRARRASCARCSSATSRATSSSPARAATAPSSPPRTAASNAPTRRSPACPAPAIRSSPPAGVGRADVWVFDAASLGTTLGGTPLTIVDALRRHAARARGERRRQHRLRGGASTPATRRRRSREGVVCNGGAPAPATCITSPGGSSGARRPPGARTPTSRASPRPRSA